MIIEIISERDIDIDKVVDMNKTMNSLNKEFKRLWDKEVIIRLTYRKKSSRILVFENVCSCWHNWHN